MFLLVLTLLTAQINANEICPPTISGTYQIISSQVQLYQDFKTIEIDYRQKGYSICHWDASLVTDTANCTIEGRHINISPDWNDTNNTHYITTAMKNKEIVIFTIQNETTVSLEGIKVVSRVIRVPFVPPNSTDFGDWDEDQEMSTSNMLLYNIIFSTTISTPVLKWDNKCLREHLYASILNSLDDLTRLIGTVWCTKQWKNHGKPDAGWQYYRMGYVMFACLWPRGKFSLSLDHKITINKQSEQHHLFNQWITVTNCMNKASQNGFPALTWGEGQMPHHPTPLECLWYGGGDHTKWENDTTLYPITADDVNKIFETIITPNIKQLKVAYPQCYLRASNRITYHDVAHLYLSKPTPGIKFTKCVHTIAIYSQPPQASAPMLLIAPQQGNKTFYKSKTDIKQFGIMHNFHVCKNGHGWHIPLFDIKITKWQSQLSKLAHDWVNQSSSLHLFPAYHPSITYLTDKPAAQTFTNLTLPAFPYYANPCEQTKRKNYRHWSKCSWTQFLNHIKSEGQRTTTLSPKAAPKWVYKKVEPMAVKAYLLELNSHNMPLTDDMLYQFLNLTEVFTQKQLDQMIIALKDKTSTIDAVSIIIKTTYQLHRYLIYGDITTCQVTTSYSICRINQKIAIIFKSNFQSRFHTPIVTSAVYPISPDYLYVNHKIEQVQHHGKLQNHSIWITKNHMILNQKLNQPPQFSFPSGEEELEVNLKPAFPNRIVWDDRHYLVREEEDLYFYTELTDTRITEILPKREFMGECYRYPLAIINNLPPTICSWPDNSLIALQQIAQKTNTSIDLITKQWVKEKTTNPASDMQTFTKRYQYPCTMVRNNPSTLFEIRPKIDILVQPQRIPCEAQLPVIFHNNEFLYDHEGYPLPRQLETTLPEYHSQSSIHHLAEVNALENIMIKDRMERHDSQFVKSFSSLEENQQLLANKTSVNALKEIKDFKSLAELSYKLSFQVQTNQANNLQLQTAIEQDHQQIHLFRHNIEQMAKQLNNQSLSIFQIHEVQQSHTRILDYLVPELKNVKTQLTKDEKLLRLIPQQIIQLKGQIIDNRDKLNTLNQTELMLVQRVSILTNRVQINQAREKLLDQTIDSVRAEQNVIKTTQHLDENKIRDNTKRIARNLRKIHQNSKRITKVNKRLNQEIKDRIQGDKDTLEKAKKYTDQAVKKAANEPWYDKVVDFFKNLPSELKSIIAWLKKLIPIIIGLFCFFFVVYLIKTFGFNPCRPCINYGVKKQARKSAQKEARKRGIALKTVNENKKKTD